MAQCDNCMTTVDADEDTHVEIVKPMEFKGKRQTVRQYYCSVECLFEKVSD